jgi:hypothetical protein
LKLQFFCKGALAALIAGCSALPALAQAPTTGVLPKKLIEAGWDKPDTARLRANLKQMENTPFDGVIIGVTGTDDAGKVVQARATFSNIPWKRAWFKSSIDDLKAVRSAKLTDNFIQVGANPGNVDWFDDAGWKEVVDHWRIAAWIAREGGLKGILFDPEPYAKPFFQLNYQAQPQREKHTLAQYQEKARQRGREVMRAISAEAPNLVLYTFFMNSVNAPATLSPNPQFALATLSYNLYPAFINGWLDEAPPTMTFVDGCESAYRYNSLREYLQAANDMRNTTLSLVAPENRRKYLAQVQASFGMYLDAYINPPTSTWYIDPAGDQPVRRLQANTGYALGAANEYVWVYGEKYRWWPTPNGSVNAQSWDEKMPGTSRALLAAAHPQQLVKMVFAELDKSGANVNLLQNGDFSSSAPAKATDAKVTDDKAAPADWKAPANIPNWSTWQLEVSHGTFRWDSSTNHSGNKNSGAAQISGVQNGCFIQHMAVKPGETYAVRAWIKQKGDAPGWIRVRWQTSEMKWTSEQQDVLLMPAPGQNAGGWQEVSGLVTVPEDAGRLVLLLSAANQSEGDSVWFDDAQVFKTS